MTEFVQLLLPAVQYSRFKALFPAGPRPAISFTSIKIPAAATRISQADANTKPDEEHAEVKRQMTTDGEDR